MEVRAIAKYVRVQPRKVRIVADEVRGKSATHTVAVLRYHPSKSAKALRKVLLSAMANAAENHGLSPEDLNISQIMIDEGPRLKRMRARAMGRGNRIIKKTSHITVVVEDVERKAAVKPHGTKAKPRPTFAAPAPKAKKGKAAVGKKAAPAEPEAVKEETTPVAAEAEAAPQIEEATPVTTSEAPEEAGSATPLAADETQSEASEEKGAE